MKPIYLEPDEEITSIIDRLSKVNESSIAVVVPKNSTMFQSLVNLKLLARQAQKLGKSVAIISNNKVGSRLAKQVGLETYATLGTVANAPSPVASSQLPVAEPVGSDTLPDGTPVHRYSPETEQISTSKSPTSDGGEKPTTISQMETPVAQSPDDKPTAFPVEPDVESEAITPEVELPGSEKKPLDVTATSDIDEARGKSKTPPSLPPIVTRAVQSRHEFAINWKSAVIAVAMVLVAGIVTFLFLPKATVTLTFPAKLLTETFILSAKTDPNIGEGIIGGNLLTVERTGTKEITATGKKDIGTKASGTINVRNCEDTNSHPLVAGTKATAGGKVFLTASTVTIPAGQFSGGGTICNSVAVAVGVSASEAGDTYNLTGANFTLSGLPSRISGSGSTSGGTTKQITVLSQTDVNAAYDELKTQLTLDGTNELKGKAGSQAVIDEAIKSAISEQKVDKEVGAQTEKATATLALGLFTIAFDQTAVEAAAKDKLATKLEDGEQLIIPSDRKPTVVFKELTDDKALLNMEITATGYAAPDIDKAALGREVNNKSASDAESFLQDKYGAESVKIEIIPGWWLKRLPLLSQAITVDYGFNEAAPQQ